MERIDKEPSLDEIASSVGQDLIGRNKDVRRFLDNLVLISPPFSIFVDARWGEGKTFFVKTIHQILVDANSNIKVTPTPELKVFVDELNEKLSEQDVYLPLYFNAWENDCDDEPLCSLLASMAIEHEYDTEELETNALGLVAGTLDFLATQLGLGIVKAVDVAGVVRRKDVLNAHKAKREVGKKLDDCINAVLFGRAKKMVIFIDELDRCRPSYAIKLLEQMKHLRSRSDVILVFSTDKTQLAHALAGIYGASFDSAKYLERFYDSKFELSDVSKIDYMEMLGLERGASRYDLVVAELVERIGPSLRDCHRLQAFKDLRTPCTNFNPDFGVEYVRYLAYSCMAPMLVAIQYVDPELWQKIKTGRNLEAFYDYARNFNSFLEGANYAISKLYNRESSEVSDEERASLVLSICVVLFETDHSSERYRSAIGASAVAFWSVPSRDFLKDLVLRGRP